MANTRLRFTHLLEWPERDKATLLAFLTLPLVLLHGGWLWFTDAFTDFGRSFFAAPGVHLTYVLASYAAAGWLVLGVAGLLLRRLGREPPAFVLLTLLFYGPSLIGLGYTVGLMAPLTGVVLLGATLVGFVLFDFWRVLAVFLFNLAVIALVSALTVVGAIEYAPLFIRDPVGKEMVSAYWVTSQFVFGLPYVVAAFNITYMLLGRWRIREAQSVRLALTDPLTGVANRRSILDVLGHELARQHRDGGNLAVVLLDLDHFKTVNDTWGHDVGDRVLVAAANSLRMHLREADWVGRYGGEEFVLVLPGADVAAAEQAVERCREAIRALVIPAGEGQELSVTASFGICCLTPGVEVTAEEALKRADTALYQAKEAGRDRFCRWSTDRAA